MQVCIFELTDTLPPIQCDWCPLRPGCSTSRTLAKTIVTHYSVMGAGRVMEHFEEKLFPNEETNVFREIIE